MLTRPWLTLALVALACGGEGHSGKASFAPSEGGSAGQPDAPTAGTGQGGTEAGGAISGSAGEPYSGAPTQAGSGGAPAPEGGTGGSFTAGTPSAAGTDEGGAPPGDPVDPLEPQPAPDCDGFVDIYVPEQTCVWLHGTFKTQNETCSVVDPQAQTCGTVTALPKDSQGHYGPKTVRVTADVTFTRLEVPANSMTCPKSCN